MMLYGTSRRQKSEKQRRVVVVAAKFASGGRGRGHLARKARLSKFVVGVVGVVVVWCTKLNMFYPKI